MNILSDKQFVLYDFLSRYADVPFYYHKVDDKYFHGIGRKLDQSTPYTTYKIMPNDTLDTLAYKAYGDPSYYWIIADYNRINDPFIDLMPGAIIRIPTLSSINFERNK